ncbi:MAG: SGNH/GDSL hydrolase family protein [Candidatus Aminicenantia bacterium]
MKKKLTLFFLLFLLCFFLNAGDYKAEIKKYVALGDSISAGFQDGGLVTDYQNESFPKLLSTQLGISDFQQPLVSQPGIPPIMVIKSLYPSIVIVPKPGLGVPLNLNLPRPYDNLAVPGANTYNLLYTVTDGGGLHDLILRGLGTQLQQCVILKPDLITLWIGNNDVLKSVMAGRVIEGVTLTPPSSFQSYYEQIITTLKNSTSAKIVLANIPDVTSIPYVTALPIYLVDPVTRKPVIVGGNLVYLIGPKGTSLSPGDYITLPASSYLAQGIGIPKTAGGTGLPLPDEVVLDKDEISAIRARTEQINSIIKNISTTFNIPLFDINSFFQKVSKEGLNVGGVKLTTAYLTGGLFSLDGVHPSSLGHAILTNEFIKILNQSFNYEISLLNLYDFLYKERKKTGSASLLFDFSELERVICGDSYKKLKEKEDK